MPSLTALITLDFAFMASLFYAGFVGTHLPAIVLFLFATRFSESRLSISAFTWLSPPRWLVVIATVWAAAQICLLLIFTFAAGLSDVFLDWMQARNDALTACGIWVPEITTLDGDGGWYDWCLVLFSTVGVLAVCILELVLVHGGVRFHTLELLDPDDYGIVKHSQARFADTPSTSRRGKGKNKKDKTNTSKNFFTIQQQHGGRNDDEDGSSNNKSSSSSGRKKDLDDDDERPDAFEPLPPQPRPRFNIAAAPAGSPSMVPSETPENPPRTGIAFVLVWAALCALAAVMYPSYLAFPLFFLYIVVVGLAVVSPHRSDRWKQRQKQEHAQDQENDSSALPTETRTQRFLSYAAHTSLLYSSLFAALLMGAQNSLSRTSSNQEVGIVSWRVLKHSIHHSDSETARSIVAATCVFLAVYVSRVLLYTQSSNMTSSTSTAVKTRGVLSSMKRRRTAGGAGRDDDEDREEEQEQGGEEEEEDASERSIWRLMLRAATGDSNQIISSASSHRSTSWWTTLFVWLVDFLLANGPLWIFPVFVITCVSSPTFLSILLLIFVFVASLNFEIFTRYAPWFYLLCSCISISVYFVNIVEDVPVAVEIVVANRARDGAALPLVFQGLASGFAALSYIFFRFAEYVARDADRHNDMKSAAALSKLRAIYWRTDEGGDAGEETYQQEVGASAASGAGDKKAASSSRTSTSFFTLSRLLPSAIAGPASSAAVDDAADAAVSAQEKKVEAQIESALDALQKLAQQGDFEGQHTLMRNLAMEHVSCLSAEEFEAELKAILLVASNAEEFLVQDAEDFEETLTTAVAQQSRADDDAGDPNSQPLMTSSSAAAATSPAAASSSDSTSAAAAAAAGPARTRGMSTSTRRRDRGASFVDPMPILAFGSGSFSAPSLAAAAAADQSRSTSTTVRVDADSDALSLLPNNVSDARDGDGTGAAAAAAASDQQPSSGYTAFNEQSAKRKQSKKVNFGEAEMVNFVKKKKGEQGEEKEDNDATKRRSDPIYRKSAVRNFILSSTLENARRRHLIDVFLSLLAHLLRSSTYGLTVFSIFVTATCEQSLDGLHLPLIVLVILAMTITIDCIWPALCLYLMLLAIFRFAIGSFDPLVADWEGQLGNQTASLAGIFSSDPSLLYLYVVTALLAVAEWRAQRSRLDPRVLSTDQWLSRRHDTRLLSDPRVVRFYRVLGLASLMAVLGYRVVWERSVVLLLIVVLFFILAGLITFTEMKLTVLWTLGVVLACLIMLLEASAQIAVTALPSYSWDETCDPGALCPRDLGLRPTRRYFELTGLLLPSFFSVALFSAMRSWSTAQTTSVVAADSQPQQRQQQQQQNTENAAPAAAAAAGGSSNAFTSQGFERIFSFAFGLVNLAERLLLSNMRFVIWGSLLFAATFNPGAISFAFGVLFVLDLRGFSVTVFSGLVILTVYILRFSLVSGNFSEGTKKIIIFIGFMKNDLESQELQYTWRLLLGPMLCFVSSLCYENLERFVKARKRGQNGGGGNGVAAPKQEHDNNGMPPGPRPQHAASTSPVAAAAAAAASSSTSIDDDDHPGGENGAATANSAVHLTAPLIDPAAAATTPAAAAEEEEEETTAETKKDENENENDDDNDMVNNRRRQEPETLSRIATLIRDVVHGCSYELLLLTHLIGSAVCIQHITGFLHIAQVTLISLIGRVSVQTNDTWTTIIRTCESVLFLAQGAVALEPGLRTLIMNDSSSKPSAWLVYLGIGEAQVLSIWTAFSLICVRVITQLQDEARKEFAAARAASGGFATLDEMLKARDGLQEQLEDTVAESEAHKTLLDRLLAGADKVRPCSPLAQRLIRWSTYVLPTAVLTFFEGLGYVSMLNAVIIFAGLVMISNQKKIHWKSHVIWKRWIWFCDAIPWIAAICNIPPCADYLVAHRIFQVIGVTRDKEAMTLSPLRVLLFFSAHVQRRIFEEFDFAVYLREIHSSRVDDAERHREMAERVARREQAEVQQAKRERRERQRRLEEMRKARFEILQPVTMQHAAGTMLEDEQEGGDATPNRQQQQQQPLLGKGASAAVAAVAVAEQEQQHQEEEEEEENNDVAQPPLPTAKKKNMFDSSSSSDEDDSSSEDDVFGSAGDDDDDDAAGSAGGAAGEWIAVDEAQAALRASFATNVPMRTKVAAILDAISAALLAASYQDFSEVKVRYPDSQWQRLFLSIRILGEAHTAHLVLLVQLVNCAASGTIFDSVLPVVGLAIAFVRSPWPPSWYWRLCIVFSMISVVVKTSLSLLASEIEFTRSAKHWLRVVIFTVPENYSAGEATSGALFIDLGLDFTILFFVLVHRYVSRRLGQSDESVVSAADDEALVAGQMGGAGGGADEEGDEESHHHHHHHHHHPHHDNTNYSSRLLEKSFMENLKTRFGTGLDVYTATVTIDGLCFLIVLAGYYSLFPSDTGGSSVLDSFRSNLLPGPLVVALLGLLLVTVVERVIYLTQATRARFALQILTVLAIHGFYIWWRNVLDLSSAAGVLLLLLKQLQCWLGATQLRRGWPMIRQHDPFSGRPVSGVYHAYMVMRSIPFLFELRTLLDWTWLRTSLPCHYHLKLEDIAHEVYLRSYDQYDHKHTNPTPGFATRLIWKILFGFAVFVGLFFLMFFPLMYYSTFNPSLVDNAVTEAEVQLRLGSVTTYFRARISTMGVDPPSQTWLSRVRPAFRTGQRSAGSKVQLFNMAECSSFNWQISPPALSLLRYMLKKAAGAGEASSTGAGMAGFNNRTNSTGNRTNCTFSYYDTNSSGSGAGSGGASSAAGADGFWNCSNMTNITSAPTTTPAPPQEKMPPITFRNSIHVARKGSVTPEGKTASFVRDIPFSREQARALLVLTEPLNESIALSDNQSTLLAEVEVGDFWNPVISSDPNTATLFTAIQMPCLLKFFTTIDPRTSAVVTYSCVECAPLFSHGNFPNRSFPEFAPCLDNDRAPNCSSFNYDRNQTSVAAAPQSPYFYVVNERIPTESGFLPNVGIIALYTTFVLAVWRVVRGFFSGMAHRVVLEDLGEPGKVKEMIDLIYLCRESKREDALELEEALYFELLDLLRGPDGLLKVTGLRSQYWAREEQRAAEKEQQQLMSYKQE